VFRHGMTVASVGRAVLPASHQLHRPEAAASIAAASDDCPSETDFMA